MTIEKNLELEHLKIKLVDRYSICILTDMIGPTSIACVPTTNPKIGNAKVQIMARKYDIKGKTIDEILEYFEQFHKNDYISFYEMTDEYIRYGSTPINTFISERVERSVTKVDLSNLSYKQQIDALERMRKQLNTDEPL